MLKISDELVTSVFRTEECLFCADDAGRKFL
jgi:hypothetical protein